MHGGELMSEDLTPAVWGSSVPEVMNELDCKLDKILAAIKTLDKAPVPTEGRMLYDPDTGRVYKMPEKNKYPVTRGRDKKL